MRQMDLINLSILVLTMMSTFPANSTDETKAVNVTRDALLQTDYIKQKIRKVEKQTRGWVSKNTGLDEKHWTYLMVGGTLAAGVITTKPFKNFKYGNNTMYFRPDIEYRFKENETKSNFNFYWEF